MRGDILYELFVHERKFFDFIDSIKCRNTFYDKYLDKLRTEKPDLFILDVMLPGIDGYTLQLQIAQDQILSQIPVIVISALKPTEKLFSGSKQVKGFISKPFSTEEFLNMIRHALE